MHMIFFITFHSLAYVTGILCILQCNFLDAIKLKILKGIYHLCSDSSLIEIKLNVRVYTSSAFQKKFFYIHSIKISCIKTPP